MDLASIELKLLQCLIALVEERSITRAAERMQLSQPRMSNVLRRLREVCDDALLVRAGHRMIPTDRAIEIAGHFRNGLEEISAALTTDRQFDPRSARRTFQVMMSDYTATLLLPEAMGDITSTAPGVAVDVVRIQLNGLRRALEDGQCELAFGYFETMHEDLRVWNCFDDAAVCIARHDLPLAGATITLDEFVAREHVIIGDATPTQSTFDAICEQLLLVTGQRRKVAAHCPTPSTIARIVARSDLLALLPLSLAEDYARFLPIRCMPVPVAMPTSTVTMVWHERSQHDAGHRWLRGQFRQAVQRFRASAIGQRGTT